MEFAIQTIGGSYEEFVTAAKWTESKGLAAFAIPDHYIYGGGQEDLATPAYDAFAVAAGLARETSTIELAITVAPVTFRHPAVLAKSTATIQEMADGRFKLGVGTGWLEVEHERFGFEFPDTSTRFAMAEEALAYLRAAFAEPPADFSGEHYSLEAFDIQPRPVLKLVIGGTGAVKTPRLAGRYADELNAFPAPPDAYAAKVARAKEAATAAGRNSDELLISSSGQVIGADTIAEYRDLVAEIARKSGRDPEDVLGEAEKRNAPMGTWDQVRAVLAGMEATGLQRFYFQGKFDPEDIELKLSKLT